MDLNNRELASLVWLVIALGWILRQPKIRSAITTFLRTLARPQIAIPVALFVAYVVVLVLLGSSIAIWSNDQAGDTLVWLIAAGGVLFGSFTQVTKDDYFKRTLKRLITGAIVVEVFVNLAVLPLPIELVLLPVVTFLILLDAYGKDREELAAGQRLVDGLLIAIGTALIAYVALHFLINLDGFDLSYALRSVALPIWLTAACLPYFYCLGLFAAYDSAYRMIGFFADARDQTRPARRCLLHLGVRAQTVGKFDQFWQREIARSDDPQTVMARFKETLRETGA